VGIKDNRSDPETTQTVSAVAVLPSDFAGRRLLVFQGALPTPHRLPERGRIVIGRGAGDADIVVDDRSLSRRHAVLELHDDGSLTVEDLGSTNGTRVRGARCEGPTPIVPGEVFSLGRLTLAVEEVVAAARPAAPDSSSASSSSVSASSSSRLDGMVTLVSGSTLSVLLHGETGSGKDVTARSIHARSPRAAAPFLALNCAALPESLLESELFGYEKGAFSGADKAKPGLFESADTGTVFLDEIAEMSPAVQAKLLRVIESRQVQRLGALRPKAIDVRFIAASHKDLQDEVDAGRFREDLYFRVNGITITLPPLRERLDELPGVVAALLAEQGRGQSVSAAAMERLMAHRWPGNFRELRTVIERAVVLSAGRPVIDVEHLVIDQKRRSASTPAAAPATTAPAPAASMAAPARPPGRAMTAVELAERDRIIAALHDAAGNQTKAAELLGVSRRTLINRIEQYDVPRPRKG
jgi:two-component system, NtrC family, response regulator AtoC